MIVKALNNFPKQFEFNPQIENSEKLGKYEKFIVVGMGGSALSAGLLKVAYPNLNVIVHRNYGLPSSVVSRQSLVICSSYSGNTEEVINGFNEALSRELHLAAITTGGKLLELAKKHQVPFIQIPDTGIEPRLATGFSLVALLKLINESEFKKLSKLSKDLDSKTADHKAKLLTKSLWDKIPIIYASTRNGPIAYNWKIALNESGKIPAFCNVFPELNHNEMTGFDLIKTTQSLNERFLFIFLKDSADHPKIIKRIGVCKKLYEDRGFKVEIVLLEGNSPWHKIFNSLLIAGWTAYHLSQYYGTEPDAVPMVEEFKKLIQ